jgi:hypothetical protein
MGASSRPAVALKGLLLAKPSLEYLSKLAIRADGDACCREEASEAREERMPNELDTRCCEGRVEDVPAEEEASAC